MKSKINNEPHAPRGENDTQCQKSAVFHSGWLKNGNPPGNPNTAKRCNAYARRTGKPCLQPAMGNGKCRLHGGKSTGPKTKQGLAASRKANWRHGEYSKKSLEEQRALKQGLKFLFNSNTVFTTSMEELKRQRAILEGMLLRLER